LCAEHATPIGDTSRLAAHLPRFGAQARELAVQRGNRPLGVAQGIARLALRKLLPL
jgi:hypothetical protein